MGLEVDWNGYAGGSLRGYVEDTDACLDGSDCDGDDDVDVPVGFKLMTGLASS